MGESSWRNLHSCLTPCQAGWRRQWMIFPGWCLVLRLNGRTVKLQAAAGFSNPSRRAASIESGLVVA